MNALPSIPAANYEEPNAPELHEPAADHAHDHEERSHRIEAADLVRIGFVALAAAAVWFRLWEPFAHLTSLASPQR